MRIDSHHHFWNYNSDEYCWIDDTMSVLRRDFTPVDLSEQIARVGIDGVISVQARQNLAENTQLLKYAAANDFIKGVVGWIPLTSQGLEAQLEEFCVNKKFIGVRHVIQGEADENYILRSDFNRGIIWLSRYNLRFDILIFERHLPQSVEFVDRHPRQTFILDHIAKPKIKTREIEPWKQNMRELSRRPNVFCKLSGLVTEANWSNWTSAQLKPYFDAVLEYFGPRRLMFGSDWPVCLVACDYQKWVQTVQGWISDLSATEQARIMGETAIEAYGLK